MTTRNPYTCIFYVMINFIILQSLKLQNQMDKDSSHYTSDQPPTSMDKADRREQLSTLNRASPLHFALRVNGQYYISYEKNQFWYIVLRSVVWIFINIAVIKGVHSLQNASDTLKSIFLYGLPTQNILYIILSFLDPGTLFQDEDDTYDQERTLCMTCSIYKLRSSKHCLWCNKCCKKHDHHCSVFGKCIAKRNLIFFYAFIILSGFQFPCLIVTIISNLLGGN